MTLRQWRYLPLSGLFAVLLWSGCVEEEAGPVAPDVEVTDPVPGLPQLTVLPSGGGSGAIFTTTPDGSIVNENVRYEGKNEVYLDGGPPPNAPASAAGLDEGFYVFQITDPPGKLQLSVDPARCRIVYVNEHGVIEKLMAPTDDDQRDPDDRTVVSYTEAATDKWADPETQTGKFGKTDFAEDLDCHVQESPDGSPGVTPLEVWDFYGLGRHDTNTDEDHGGDAQAIVVQMMPYGTTPNPGGVYKAWMTPIQAYLANGGKLNVVPVDKNGKVRPHDCPDFCADRDPGFGPSQRYTKTDNFKVTEKFPAEILVRKFHDVNGDGLWQMGTEPEIDVDECIDQDGLIIDCGDGGWPFDYTEPIESGSMTTGPYYTPESFVAGVPGTYSAEEYYFADIDNGGYNKWRQTASWLDGSYQTPFQKRVDVEVAASGPGETHEIRFGNTLLGKIRGKKVIDYDADGLGGKDVCDKDDTANAPGCVGVTVKLDGTDNMGRTIPTQSTTTGNDGSFEFKDLWPGSYTVTIDEPTGFSCSYPDPCQYTGIVINSGDDVFLGVGGISFTDWTYGKKQGVKSEDTNGDGILTETKTLGGWTIDLLKQVSGVWTYVESATTDGTDGSYEFDELTPGVQYGVCEVLQSGYTQTYPSTTGTLDCSAIDSKYGDVGYAFVLESGEVEQNNNFGNFENVDVTVCKLKDQDGLVSSTDDRTPVSGWTVYLTINDNKVESASTGADGCFTWNDLPPLTPGSSYTGGYGSVTNLPANSYYDAAEEVGDWMALGGYEVVDGVPGTFMPGATGIDFAAPPQSGATFKAVFVNTPTQGCTPGFWQGGTAGGQAGGQWLWNELGAWDGDPADPQWLASGGAGINPYNHDDSFCDVFGCGTYGGTTGDMWYFVNPSMWASGDNDDFHKAARSLTAAYLNATWGMAYAYTVDELIAMWNSGNPLTPFAGMAALHDELDKANNYYYNPEGSCPISASF